MLACSVPVPVSVLCHFAALTLMALCYSLVHLCWCTAESLCHKFIMFSLHVVCLIRLQLLNNAMFS